jgi:phage terminase large subunit
VRGINVGETAASRDNCMRLRDELWFKGREWFQDRACSMPQDDTLIAELTAPTYTFTSTGKMVVESKADMKKRGLRSPDLADAFLLTFAGSERRKERYRKPEPRRCSAWAV